MMHNLHKSMSAKTILNFLLIFLLTHYTVFAQDGSVTQDVDILEKQKTVLMEDYPGAFAEVEIKDIQKINSRHSKVFYEKGNQQYEAVVNSDRQDMLLVATSKVMSENEMPKIVMDAFKSSKYRNWNLEKTYEVTTPYSGLFYRVDVSKKKMNKKKKTKSIFYSNLGQYKKSPY